MTIQQTEHTHINQQRTTQQPYAIYHLSFAFIKMCINNNITKTNHHAIKHTETTRHKNTHTRHTTTAITHHSEHNTHWYIQIEFKTANTINYTNTALKHNRTGQTQPANASIRSKHRFPFCLNTNKTTHTTLWNQHKHTRTNNSNRC